MRILSIKENDKFFVDNNHLFYCNNQCLVYLGDDEFEQYWKAKRLKPYETGVLVTKYCGYEKVSKIMFFGNDGKRLFSIDTDNLPFDVNLYKSKPDNINAIVFDNGVLVSMKNVDNQSKFMFYFYDKSFITSYDFKNLISKVEALSKKHEYTDMILNQLQSSDNDNFQNL